MKLSVKIITTDEEIIANCPELDINCYGSTKEEAIRRIKNVIKFYVESARELGLDVDALDEITVEGEVKSKKMVYEMVSNTNTIN